MPKNRDMRNCFDHKCKEYHMVAWQLLPKTLIIKCKEYHLVATARNHTGNETQPKRSITGHDNWQRQEITWFNLFVVHVL